MKKKLLGGAVHGKPKPVNKCSKNTIASNGIRAEINDESADDEETAPSKPPKKVVVQQLRQRCVFKICR